MDRGGFGREGVELSIRSGATSWARPGPCFFFKLFAIGGHTSWSGRCRVPRSRGFQAPGLLGEVQHGYLSVYRDRAGT